MIEWTTSAKAELERLLSSHRSGLQHRGAAPDLHCSRAMGRPRGGVYLGLQQSTPRTVVRAGVSKPQTPVEERADH